MSVEIIIERMQKGIDTPLKEAMSIMKQRKMSWKQVAEWFGEDHYNVRSVAKHYGLLQNTGPSAIIIDDTGLRATAEQLNAAAQLTGLTASTIRRRLYADNTSTLDDIIKRHRRMKNVRAATKDRERST